MPKLAPPKTDAAFRTAKPTAKEQMISDGGGLALLVKPIPDVDLIRCRCQTGEPHHRGELTQFVHQNNLLHKACCFQVLPAYGMLVAKAMSTRSLLLNGDSSRAFVAATSEVDLREVSSSTSPSIVRLMRCERAQILS